MAFPMAPAQAAAVSMMVPAVKEVVSLVGNLSHTRAQIREVDHKIEEIRLQAEIMRAHIDNKTKEVLGELYNERLELVHQAEILLDKSKAMSVSKKQLIEQHGKLIDEIVKASEEAESNLPILLQVLQKVGDLIKTEGENEVVLISKYLDQKGFTTLEAAPTDFKRLR